MDPYIDREKDAFFMDIERRILLLMADDEESSFDVARRNPKENKTWPSLPTEWDYGISRSAGRRRHSNPRTPQRLRTKQPAAVNAAILKGITMSEFHVLLPRERKGTGVFIPCCPPAHTGRAEAGTLGQKRRFMQRRFEGQAMGK